jgi:hypothetical protein
MCASPSGTGSCGKSSGSSRVRPAVGCERASGECLSRELRGLTRLSRYLVWRRRRCGNSNECAGWGPSTFALWVFSLCLGMRVALSWGELVHCSPGLLRQTRHGRSWAGLPGSHVLQVPFFHLDFPRLGPLPCSSRGLFLSIRLACRAARVCAAPLAGGDVPCMLVLEGACRLAAPLLGCPASFRGSPLRPMLRMPSVWV